MRRLFCRFAAVTAAFVLFFVWIGMPCRLPAQAALQIPGIDISKYQGEIDWKTVAASGEKFAIIRCCMVLHDSAVFEFDERFDENYSGAREAGLPVGCYIYTDAATEAEFMEDVDFLLPVFDVESKARQEHLPKSVFMPPLLAALARVEQAGHTAGVYANTAFFSECLDRSMLTEHGYHIWEANYFNTVNGLYSPAGHDLSATAGIWQYSGCGRVKGIKTIVDRNVCYSYKYFQHEIRLSDDAVMPFGILEEGSPYAVSGTVSSDFVIRSVTGTIIHTKSELPTGQNASLTPNARSVRLDGEFSSRLVFSALDEGEYTLRLTAVDSSGKTCMLADRQFQVYQSAKYEPGKRSAQVAVDHVIEQAGSTGTTTATTAATTTETTVISETTAELTDSSLPVTTAPPDETAQTVTQTALHTRPPADPARQGLSSNRRFVLECIWVHSHTVKLVPLLTEAAEFCRSFGWNGFADRCEEAAGDVRRFWCSAEYVLNAKNPQ